MADNIGPLSPGSMPHHPASIGPVPIAFVPDLSGFDAVEKKLADIGKSVGGLETALGGFETRLGSALTGVLTTIEARLNTIVAKVHDASQHLGSTPGAGPGGHLPAHVHAGVKMPVPPPIGPAVLPAGTGDVVSQLAHMRIADITGGLPRYEVTAPGLVSPLAQRPVLHAETALSDLERALQTLAAHGGSAGARHAAHLRAHHAAQAVEAVQAARQRATGAGVGQLMLGAAGGDAGALAALKNALSTDAGEIFDALNLQHPDIGAGALAQQAGAMAQANSARARTSAREFATASFLASNEQSLQQRLGSAQQTLGTLGPSAVTGGGGGRMGGLGVGIGAFLGSEALNGATTFATGPLGTLGRPAAWASSWQTAVPNILATGQVGLAMGVGPQAALNGLLGSAEQQRMPISQVAQTAALQNQFANVRGAAFLFKDAASTYQFATFLGLSPQSGAQLAGQAVGGGSAANEATLLNQIAQISRTTGMSTTAVANLVSAAQQAQISAAMPTSSAPELAGGLLSLARAAGMSPNAANAAVGQNLGALQSPQRNLLSTLGFAQAYLQVHPGASAMQLANASVATPGTHVLFQQIRNLQSLAKGGNQLAFQIAAQGALGPNVLGPQMEKYYKEFQRLHPSQLEHLLTHPAQVNPNAPGPHGGANTLTHLLTEEATAANAFTTAGAASINLAHQLGAVTSALATFGAHLGLATGMGSLLGSFLGSRGGRGGGPSGGGGGGLAAEMAGFMGCKPCEQQAADAGTATAANTSAIANTLKQMAPALGATIGLGAGAGALGLLSPGASAAGLLGGLPGAAGSMAGALMPLAPALSSVFGAGYGLPKGLTASLNKQFGMNLGGVPATSPTSITIPGAGSTAGYTRAFAAAAIQAANATGLPPQLILAQWADESNWGKSGIDNNYAGIKWWGAPVVSGEYNSGVQAKDGGTFAGFQSLQNFGQGYAAFLQQNSRYAPLLAAARQGASADTLAQMLQQSGYAGTSTTYAATITAIMNQMGGSWSNQTLQALAKVNLAVARGQLHGPPGTTGASNAGSSTTVPTSSGALPSVGGVNQLAAASLFQGLVNFLMIAGTSAGAFVAANPEIVAAALLA